MSGVLLLTILLAAGLLLLALRWANTRWTRWKAEIHRLQKLNDKMVADLVDRRAIERELAHMASFSEMAPNPIIETDTTGNLRYINPAALAIFPDLQSTGSSHPAFEGIGRVLDSLKRDGKAMMTRPIKVGERIYDQQITLLDGGPDVRLYFSDITELKHLDQLKTDFVNMVSHELRSPLTAINASIRLVSGGLLGITTQDQQNALQLAQRNIERLSRLINELLDIAKIEAGKLELHCESADLNTMVAEVLRNFEPLARERGLELRCRLPEGPQELFVDRDKIVQVFTNLIQNALKFTQKGSVEISIQPEPDGVHCQVSDTGQGISENDLPKVFGKFQQFSTVLYGKEKGTGLGLSLCKGFVELHGGHIRVESKPGTGSAFIFFLPRLSAEGIFRNQVQRFLQEAVSHEQPLTLVKFTIERWKLTMTGSHMEEPDVILHRLEAVVKSAFGVESVVVAQRQSAVWLALPEIAKMAAQNLATRVQTDFGASLQKPESVPSNAVQVKLVSYPEDGSLPEQLMERLIAA